MLTQRDFIIINLQGTYELQPIMRHTIEASSSPQESSHIVPHSPRTKTSTLPSTYDVPPTNRTDENSYLFSVGILNIIALTTVSKPQKHKIFHFLFYANLYVRTSHTQLVLTMILMNFHNLFQPLLSTSAMSLGTNCANICFEHSYLFLQLQSRYNVISADLEQ